MTSGELLKDARRRHGVSQHQLAVRAGTTQSAISRIERDRVSPTIQTLGELLQLLGEDLVLMPKKRETGIDPTLNRSNLELSAEHRVQEGHGICGLRTT